MIEEESTILLKNIKQREHGTTNNVVVYVCVGGGGNCERDKKKMTNLPKPIFVGSEPQPTKALFFVMQS